MRVQSGVHPWDMCLLFLPIETLANNHTCLLLARPSRAEGNTLPYHFHDER